VSCFIFINPKNKVAYYDSTCCFVCGIQISKDRMLLSRMSGPRRGKERENNENYIMREI
jgi:hypothetical protein